MFLGKESEENIKPGVTSGFMFNELGGDLKRKAMIMLHAIFIINSFHGMLRPCCFTTTSHPYLWFTEISFCGEATYKKRQVKKVKLHRKDRCDFTLLIVQSCCRTKTFVSVQ
jgi:hypothetical protein